MAGSGLRLRLSNGLNDRLKYKTNDPTGYEPAAGAFISGRPCILMSAYISIRETLVGTVFIQFWDVGPGANGVAPTLPANQAAWDTCSEPLTTPGGTFIWQPDSTEAVQYQYPRGRKMLDACPVPGVDQPAEISGFPFDNGLVIAASLAKSSFVAAAANLIRVTCFVRSPAEQNG